LVVVGVELGLAQVGARDDGWENLRRVSEKASLTFMRKDGSCEVGTILKVEPTKVTVKTNAVAPIGIDKPGLLLVGEGPGPHDLIYSGRSSWADVVGAKPSHAESLVVTMKNGKSHTGKPVSASVDAIVLRALAGAETLPKGDISRVTYVRQKPLTDGEEYIGQEAPFLMLFSPMTYVRAAGISLKLDVPLYDASAPEDDSALKCQPTKGLAPVK
jgi:hypothetical protein